MKTATRSSIFIVEDDPRFRETFVDVGSLRGLRIQTAGTAFEALRLLEKIRPALIILDVRLPDMHGFELCRRLKRMEHFQKTPVIFVSASTQYNDPRDRVEGLLAGATLFIAKPIKLDTFWGEIEYLLKQHS